MFLGRSFFRFPSGVQLRAGLSSHYVSDPSPSPLHNDCVHAVLVVTGEKILVGDGLGPEHAFGVEGEQFIEVTFSHPPHSRLVRTQLWYSLSLVLVLY